MKIKLLVDLPIDEKYKMFKGTIHEVVEMPKRKYARDNLKYIIKSECGEKVGVLYREAEEITK